MSPAAQSVGIVRASDDSCNNAARWGRVGKAGPGVSATLLQEIPFEAIVFV